MNNIFLLNTHGVASIEDVIEKDIDNPLSGNYFINEINSTYIGLVPYMMLGLSNDDSEETMRSLISKSLSNGIPIMDIIVYLSLIIGFPTYIIEPEGSLINRHLKRDADSEYFGVFKYNKTNKSFISTHKINRLFEQKIFDNQDELPIYDHLLRSRPVQEPSFLPFNNFFLSVPKNSTVIGFHCNPVIAMPNVTTQNNPDVIDVLNKLDIDIILIEQIGRDIFSGIIEQTITNINEHAQDKNYCELISDILELREEFYRGARKLESHSFNMSIDIDASCWDVKPREDLDLSRHRFDQLQKYTQNMLKEVEDNYARYRESINTHFNIKIAIKTVRSRRNTTTRGGNKSIKIRKIYKHSKLSKKRNKNIRKIYKKKSNKQIGGGECLYNGVMRQVFELKDYPEDDLLKYVLENILKNVSDNCKNEIQQEILKKKKENDNTQKEMEAYFKKMELDTEMKEISGMYNNK